MTARIRIPTKRRSGPTEPMPCQCWRLPIPPSANNLFATVHGHRVRSLAYKSWIELAGFNLLQSFPNVTPCRVTIHVTGGRGWRANRDLGNIEKPVLDLLVTCGVLPDDNTKYVRCIELRFHPGFDPECDASMVVNTWPEIEATLTR